MKFSFITCTYNRGHYLERTLDSVCNQMFDYAAYEIIIVDNNSSDNTPDICENARLKYADRSIRYFREINQGLSFALNRGIKEAQGEYLIFVDDDETIEPEYLTRLDLHTKTLPEVKLFGSPVIPVYEIKEPKWMSRFTQRLIGGYFNQGQSVKELDTNNYPGTGHTIIKKELYKKYGYYNTDLGRKGTSLMGAEDKDMFNRLKNNQVACYYLPDIPIYHHIPAYKMTDDFFHKLTYSIGKSERVRTKSISEKEFRNRLFTESIKWVGSFILCAGYIVMLKPTKGTRLIRFRWNVSKGLLGK